MSHILKYKLQLFITLVSLCITSTIEAEPLQKYSLIGHQSTPTTVNVKTVTKLFSGRQQSWKSSLVQLILLPEGSPEMRWLCNEILKMPERLLRRFINQRVYRGVMTPPIEADDTEHALRLLRKIAGSIAPINRELLQKSQLKSQSIHIITVAQDED